ncbi:putative reverse transcriptase domain-containing protein [Tanacetum coccineum]|uniref:Reverse transcriptase domain-containing protein n=1 Tax=Tanacetum coccineum TaxID=301880 RepID=A0ABQ5DF59_9ASTR
MTDSTTTAKQPKRPLRHKRTWTPQEDEKLMEAMMELQASGRYVADNGFKPGYPQAIQDLMDVSLPNLGLQAYPHIKFRLKTLKGNFGVMHDMVLGSSTNGFGWDRDKCVVAAPNDLWDAYVKIF